MKIESIKKNPTSLRKQVENEYAKWLDHVTNQRVAKRKVNDKLLKQPSKQGQVISRSLWRYMKLWMSINVLDWILVEFTPMWENISSEIAENTNRVAKADYKTMDMFNIDWQVKWNVGLLWLWVKVFSGWDKLDKVPVAQSVDPLAVIPDPQYMNAKDMRFIWFEQRSNIYSLTEEDWYFWVDEIIRRKWEVSQEVQDNQDAIFNANNYPVTIADDYMIDIYNHYIYFKWKKYLTTWVWNRKILIKIVEILPKTKAEKRDPRKIKYPVEFFRSNPILWLFFGASFWDEIGQYADAETVLDNLELILARKIAMWDDRFINTSIIDIKTLQSKIPWGRLIPVKLGQNENINNSIFTVPQENPWTQPQIVSQKLSQKQEETTAISNVAFWMSPQGNQTKSEINTLQQNMNGLLSYSVTMLMESEKRIWELWYWYYVFNLHPNSKKFISLTKWSWIRDQFNFKKSEFIIDAPVDVEVKSKAQEKIKKEKKFARFQIIMWTILPNTEPWSYAFNEIMREYMTLWDLERDQILKYIPYSIDEITALEWLVLLEGWEKPAWPKEWQDFNTFINYYSNAKDSDNKNEVIQEFIDAQKGIQTFEKTQKLLWGVPEEWGQIDSIAQGQVWNMIAQENQGWSSSIQDVQV